jgi:hypothetical protein
MLIQPPLVLAQSEGIFLPISSARKVASDLDFYKKTTSNDANVIYNLKQQNDGLVNLSVKCAEKSKLLEQDKVILTERGDRFEKVYSECSDNLNKCNEDKPSRYTWFSLGAITTLVLGLVVGFLVTK